MSSSSLHPSIPSQEAPRVLWTFQMAGVPRGLVLAREKGTYLAWDDHHWLYLRNRRGEPQGQLQARGKVAAACGADDGSAYAAVGKAGEVWWLAPDLSPRWERSIGARAVAAALDPFGQYLAVSDTRGRLHLFDCLGRDAGRGESPRPLHHLAFVPEAGRLVAAADFGLVLGFDAVGHCLWRDGLVAHYGSLAVTGDGHAFLACYTDGLRAYAPDGTKQPRLNLGEPCRLAAVTYDGRRLLSAGMGGRLYALSPRGQVLGKHNLETPVAALALSALGDQAAVALDDGRVLGLEVRQFLKR